MAKKPAGTVPFSDLTPENHPFVVVDDATGMATVRIPLDHANLRACALITLTEIEEFDFAARWLGYADGSKCWSSIVGGRNGVKKDNGHWTFQCHASYLNGKFWPSSAAYRSNTSSTAAAPSKPKKARVVSSKPAITEAEKAKG